MKRMVFYASFAVAVLAPFALIVQAVSASEKPAGGSIASGETREGTITSPSFLEQWTFEGTEGDRVIISAVTTSGALNTEIYLYPPGGGAFEAQTIVDRLDHQLQESGVYTIVIQDYLLDHAGDYQITLLKIPGTLTCAWDLDGGPIAPGETLSGKIDVFSDLDGFQFYGDAGDRVIIAAVTTSGDLNTEIYLYPPGGGAFEAQTIVDPLDHQLQDSGLYTIVIHDYYLNDAGDYQITLLKIPGTLTCAWDLDGGPIAPGETLSGKMDVASDLDGFQFYGDAGDRVIIAPVTTSGALNTEIYLYPPAGGAFEAQTIVDRLDHQLQESGVYTIVIQDYLVDHAGDYQITLLKIPGTLTCAWDLDGGPIAPGETLSGKIDVASDLDGFQFYGDAGDRVIIAAVTTSGDLNTEIYLYPPGGGAFEAQTIVDRLDHQLQNSGLYTIVIHDHYLNDAGDYSISLAKIPSDLRPGIYGMNPLDGDTVFCLWVLLQWDSVPGATGYDVFFGTDVIEPLAKVGDNVATSEKEVSGLVSGETYYWRVVAHHPAADIEGRWSWFSVNDTPPEITLLGDNPLTWECGTQYVEPGYTATDTCDGDLTGSVIVTGSVNHTTLGSYVLYYNVCDSSGNCAEETRAVNVVHAIPFKVVQILELADGTIQISWVSCPNTNYGVWSCYDLQGGAWNKETTVSSEGETTTCTDDDPAGMCKFYKIGID